MTSEQTRQGQFLRFGAVGIVNTLIDFGVLNLLVLFLASPVGWGLLLCNAVAFCCANLNSYVGNKYWTFSDDRRATLGQYASFLWVSLIGLALNSLLLWCLVDLLPPESLAGSYLWLNLSKVVATAANLVWNFYAYRSRVFVQTVRP
jgi:putative flippase GtrA